jgi:hypothetical protein
VGRSWCGGAFDGLYRVAEGFIMLIKAGVDISRLKPCIRKKLTKIEHAMDYYDNEELVITSTYEGNHSPGSLHYSNEAIDIRRKEGKKKGFKQIKLFLGDDYDVICYETHIHIEYDPK